MKSTATSVLTLVCYISFSFWVPAVGVGYAKPEDWGSHAGAAPIVDSTDIGTVEGKGAPLKSIAVLDFAPYNVTQDTASGVSDLLSIHLWKTALFKVMERPDVTGVVRGITGAPDGVWVCDEVACATNLGMKLRIDNVVIGSVTEFGEMVTISVRLVDVGSGEVVAAEAVKSEEGMKGIPLDVENLAALLVGQETKEDPDVHNFNDYAPEERRPVTGSIVVRTDREMDVYCDDSLAGSGMLVTIHSLEPGVHVIWGKSGTCAQGTKPVSVVAVTGETAYIEIRCESNTRLGFLSLLLWLLLSASLST